jgi:hypothetical protein
MAPNPTLISTRLLDDWQIAMDGHRQTRWFDDGGSQQFQTSPSNKRKPLAPLSKKLTKVPRTIAPESPKIPKPPSPILTTLIPRAKPQRDAQLLRPINGDPWTFYKRIIEVKLGGTVELAYPRSDLSQTVAIRRLEEGQSTIEEQLHMIDQIRHRVFLETLEIFLFSSEYYVVAPYLQLTLEYMLPTPMHPTEGQIAYIMHEVIRP